HRRGCSSRRSRSSTHYPRCPIRAERRSWNHGNAVAGLLGCLVARRDPPSNRATQQPSNRYNRAAMPMERFVVEGGRSLEGTIRPGGNKNAALPILAACLLTDEPVVLRNMPDIQDVRVMLQILEGMGVRVERLEKNVVRIHARDECSPDPDHDL